MSYQHTGPLNVDEARRHIGERVAYSGPAIQPAVGIITSVGPGWNGYVFVRYGTETTSKPTRAEALVLV